MIENDNDVFVGMFSVTELRYRLNLSLHDLSVQSRDMDQLPCKTLFVSVTVVLCACPMGMS
jgi:hypothetical protein